MLGERDWPQELIQHGTVTSMKQQLPNHMDQGTATPITLQNFQFEWQSLYHISKESRTRPNHGDYKDIL